MLYIGSLIINNVSYFYNNFRRLSVFVSAIVMVILFRGTDGRTTPDYSVYQQQYNMNSNYFEMGYNSLVHFGNFLGMDYPTFRLLFSILAVAIFTWAVFRVSTEPEMAVTGYMISAFFADIVQIRQFMMISLVLLGYSFFKNKTVKNIIIGFVFLILSSEFHSLGWMFVLMAPLCFVPISKQMKLLKWTTIIFIGLAVVTRLLPKSIVIAFTSAIIGNLSSRQNIDTNIADVYTNGGGIGVFVVTLLILVLMLWAIFKIPEIKYTDNIRILMPGIFIVLLSLALVSVSIDYTRLLRAASILILIIFSNLLHGKEKWRYFIYLYVIGFMVCYLQVGLIYKTNGFLLPYILGFTNPDVVSSVPAH